MRMAAALVPLFDIAIDDIVAALPGADDPIWDVFRVRQRTYDVHAKSRSIAFQWQAEVGLEGQWPILTNPDNPAALTEAVNACAARLAAHYPGTVTRLMLTELAPGEKIPPHRDSGAALERTHRCHVPIVSHRGVKFFIDGDCYYLEPGRAYEVDNIRVHSVENTGTAPRVHLICNILPAG